MVWSVVALHDNNFSFTEYATVGYRAKRIQMRKNRFLALQKMAEQKKAAMDHHDEHHAKQTVRSLNPFPFN